MKRFSPPAIALAALMLCLAVLGACSQSSPPATEDPVSYPPPVTPSGTAPPPPPPPSETPDVTQTVPAITPTPSQDAVKEWAQNDVRVTPDVWSQTYADDAGTYQFASVSVPALTGAPQTVTDYYATLKMNFIARADVLAEQAKADRGSASARPYDITQSYLVECNSGGFISVRHASMEDQGGAHGETRTFCDNFRLSDGKLLTLDDFFKAERAVYLPVLIDEIKTQLAAKSGDFYVGWEEYVENEEVFPFDAFVMTPGGLSLFYSESVIAPYVIGTIRVDIPWESIENIWTLP